MKLQKILLRAPNWVGDVAFAVPAMKSIRSKFPGSEIVVMARPSVAGILASVPFVDRVWTEPKPAGLRDWMRIAREIRREHFDLAVLFPNSFESAAMLFWGRVPRRIGHSLDGRGWMLTRRLPGKRRGIHQVDYYLQLAQAVDADISNPSIDLAATPEARANARKLLAAAGIQHDARFLILSPGAASGGAKRWGDRQFAAAADTLSGEFYLAVVLVGSAGERSISESIRTSMKKSAVVLNGKTSMETLVGLIAESTLLLGNDSGPVHLACALGIPTVAVFGATDAEETGPYGSRARVVREPVECSPCRLDECPIDHRCMTRVTPEMVCAAAREVLLHEQ